MTGLKCRISFKSIFRQSLILRLLLLLEVWQKMNLVKVKGNFFKKCKSRGADPNNQLLHNEAGRPCVLIVKLRYKGQKRSFIVPLKSNITPNTDKNTFFALPPNSRTKPGNFHGIYYVKLFPITKKYVQPYLYEGDTFLTKVVNIIDTNDDTIIKACQDYLNEYIKGNRNAYTPDIDAIIELLDNEENNKDTN